MSENNNFSNITLSVILPAFNESKGIKESLTKTQEALEKLNVSFEILVVDDGSSDDTSHQARALKSPFVKVVSYPMNRGKGFAVNVGMKEAKGEYRLFMDVDLSTSLEALGRFLSVLETNSCDVVVGTRKGKGAYLEVKQPYYRIFLGSIFTYLAGLVTGCPLSDFTCGFKMYSRQAAEVIFSHQRINNWSFDAELILIARFHQLRIQEMPVTWKNDLETKVNPLRDALSSLKGLWLMRCYAAKGFYR